MIAHISTVINTVFVQLDDAGDVVKKFPYTLEVAKLDDGQWAEALKALTNIRNELRGGGPKEEAPAA